jgi:hypothetical protein
VAKPSVDYIPAGGFVLFQAMSMALTSRHRQFMEHLQSGDWTKAASLKSSPRVVAKLLEDGLIEQRVRGSDLAYRMTIAGFIAKGRPTERP